MEKTKRAVNGEGVCRGPSPGGQSALWEAGAGERDKDDKCVS